MEKKIRLSALSLAATLGLGILSQGALLWRKDLNPKAKHDIASSADVGCIKEDLERRFAKVVIAAGQSFSLIHEPHTIAVGDTRRKEGYRSTLPDFLLTQTNTGRQMYIEIGASLHCSNKGKQWWVMQSAGYGSCYIQLSKTDIEQLERDCGSHGHHTAIDDWFFSDEGNSITASLLNRRTR